MKRRRKNILLARSLLEHHPELSKSALARSLGISRSTLYVKTSKQAEKDKAYLQQIIEVQANHSHYGHRRIAIDISRNTKLVRRIMHKYGLKVKKRRKRPRKRADEGRSISDIPNRIKGMCPIFPSVIWVADFTYLDFHGTYIFLATVIDRFSREVVGTSIGLYRSAQLVIDALEDALRKRAKPQVFHSDQGSEYDSKQVRLFLLAHRIQRRGKSRTLRSYLRDRTSRKTLPRHHRLSLQGLRAPARRCTECATALHICQPLPPHFISNANVGPSCKPHRAQLPL